MYRPPYTEVSRVEAMKLVHDFPFATVVTADAGAPFVNHLPLILMAGAPGEPPRLLGHMSRRNPQWQHMQRDRAVLAIFNGPHTYITPRWYMQHDVPTWNYAVVHIRGDVRVLEDVRDLTRILALATERFEGHGPEAWRFGLPDDLKEPGLLAQAIVGFEITIQEVDAKFKLSQNRDDSDRLGVLKGLESRDDEQSAGVLELMRRAESQRPFPSR